jgi:hypothetical protein
MASINVPIYGYSDNNPNKSQYIPHISCVSIYPNILPIIIIIPIYPRYSLVISHIMWLKHVKTIINYPFGNDQNTTYIW